MNAGRTRTQPAECTAECCCKPPNARGLCNVHYEAFRPNKAERKTKRDTWNRSAEGKDCNRRWKRSVDGSFLQMNTTAKIRGYDCNLTKEAYADLVKDPCFYCGGFFGRFEDAGGSFLDRIDNSKGYVEGNVLPCCGFCNKSRGDRFTVEETQEVISLLIHIRTNKKEN